MYSSLVQLNLLALIAQNESMTCALRKAKNGSEVEDGYFIEKLEKTARVMGFELVSQKGEITKQTGELLQHDIQAFCDGLPDEIINGLCDIVISYYKR